MKKCIIISGFDWNELEEKIDQKLEEGYKIINSLLTTKSNYPYLCIIMIKE